MSTTPRQSSHPDDIILIHPQAHVIVWLTERLKALCSVQLNYLSKYEFYGRVGESALAYLAGREQTESRVWLRKWCEAVLDEEERLYQEWLSRIEARER